VPAAFAERLWPSGNFTVSPAASARLIGEAKAPATGAAPLAVLSFEPHPRNISWLFVKKRANALGPDPFSYALGTKARLLADRGGGRAVPPPSWRRGAPQAPADLWRTFWSRPGQQRRGGGHDVEFSSAAPKPATLTDGHGGKASTLPPLTLSTAAGDEKIPPP